jgi:peptide/nickel transport system substrate-binding protein
MRDGIASRRRRGPMGSRIRTHRGAAAVLAVAIAAGAASMAMAGVALAQSESASAQASSKKTTFTVGTTNDAITFNPMFMIETPEYNTADLIYNTFLTWDQGNYDTKPLLATDWTQSDDGLTWTFNVRDDIKWQDGTPLTAEDIAYTFNWIIEQGVGNFIDYLPFTEPGGITATSPTTLEWKTTQPTSAPIYPPYVYILPKEVLSKYKDKADFRAWKGFPDAIGSGPFKLVDWSRGDFWRLEANPDYFQGAPHFDEFVYRVFKNEEAMAQALKQGEIDFADDISANIFDSLKGISNITANVGSPSYFIQMSFNQCSDAVKYCKDTGWNHSPATTDPAFREAVEYAIDRDVLVDRVKLGYATPGATVIMQPKWHTDPNDLITYDPEKAKQILEDAGYVDTDGDGIRELPDSGDPLKLRFIVRTESPETITAGDFITEWLRDVGIDTDVQAVNDNKLTDVWYSNDYDMYIWGWGVEPDPNFQLSTYTTSQCGVWSDTCYSNADYDKLFTEQQRATTIEDRQAVISQMQQILYDDRPEIVLWYENYLQAYRNDRWTGFVKQPTQGNGNIFFQYGHYSDLSIKPVSGAAQTSNEGIPVWVWIAIAVVVVAVGAFVFARRRREEEDVV